MSRPGLAAHVTSPAPQDAWQAVYDADRDALVTQSPAWTAAIVTGGWQDVSRLYRLADGRELVLPLVRKRNIVQRAITSSSFPNSWGYGGVVGSGADPDALRTVADDLSTLRSCMVQIRPNPLHAAGYVPATERWRTKARRAHIISLDCRSDEIWARFNGSLRRGVRHAQREELQVEVDMTGRLIPEFHRLLMLSVDRWAGMQHEPPALARWRAGRRDPISKFEAWSRALGPAMRVLVARRAGVAISAIVVLQGANAHYTRGAMDRERMGGSRANELLLWTAIEAAAESGCHSFHMGESGESTTLANFKEKFGATAHDYAELRLEHVPITPVDQRARSAVKRVLRFRDT